MNTSDKITRYTATPMLLHWLVALLIFSGLGLGFYMTGLKISPTKLQLYSYHKWIGVTVFALALLRIVWAATHRAPAMAAMPAWQALAASVTHKLLYILMLAIPLSGWLMSSAKGFQTVYLGLLPIPDLMLKDEPLGEGLAALHAGLNWLLLALLAAHVGAALFHQFVVGDGTLSRMLPAHGRGKKAAAARLNRHFA
jgi:cytochrome b561